MYGHSRLEVPEVSVILECGAVSLGEWYQTFQDNVVLSSSGVEISMKFTYNPHEIYIQSTKFLTHIKQVKL
jgi:hypothetical protein